MGTVMKAVAVPICLLAALASPRTLARFEFERAAMGTRARVVLYAGGAAEAERLAARAFARIADLDRVLSDYRHDSELMELCRGAGGPARRVSADLFRVLEQAQRIARASDGAFDVTIGPVSRLWRQARTLSQKPDPGELAAAQQRVDYRNLVLSAPARSVRLLKPGMMLDLGGIGKGFAADEALKTLRAAGVSSALVALGGDIVVGEAPPDKDGWQIAVSPLGLDGPHDMHTRMLRHAAVSTSGDAEQFMEAEGVRYSHLLDPASGKPKTGRHGVTVVAADGATADAVATAAAVMGTQRGLALVETLPGVAALFIDRSESQGDRHNTQTVERKSTRW
jgi:FAD:protein FMN transferase